MLHFWWLRCCSAWLQSGGQGSTIFTNTTNSNTQLPRQQPQRTCLLRPCFWNSHCFRSGCCLLFSCECWCDELFNGVVKCAVWGLRAKPVCLSVLALGRGCERFNVGSLSFVWMRQNLCIKERVVVLRAVAALARDLGCLEDIWSLTTRKRRLNKLRAVFLSVFNPAFLLLTLFSASIWLLRPENLLISPHQIRKRRAGESRRRKESRLFLRPTSDSFALPSQPPHVSEKTFYVWNPEACHISCPAWRWRGVWGGSDVDVHALLTILTNLNLSFVCINSL